MTISKQEEKKIRRLIRQLRWSNFRMDCSIVILEFGIYSNKILNRIADWISPFEL